MAQRCLFEWSEDERHTFFIPFFSRLFYFPATFPCFILINVGLGVSKDGSILNILCYILLLFINQSKHHALTKTET